MYCMHFLGNKKETEHFFYVRPYINKVREELWSYLHHMQQTSPQLLVDSSI